MLTILSQALVVANSCFHPSPDNFEGLSSVIFIVVFEVCIWRMDYELVCFRMQVQRKAEATSATSTPIRLARRFSSAMVARTRCHLSGTIAKANAEQKGAVPSIHQLPASLESEKTQEKISCTQPPAAA